jgi:carboxyl-terminal processing protease
MPVGVLLLSRLIPGCNAGELYTQATGSNKDLLVELRYNDSYSSDNLNYYLKLEPNTLDFDELTVMTTEMTCSAIELIVAALRPCLNRVITIGGTSCGKPVGMIPVNCASFNVDGQDDYFGGIAADCAVVDDASVAFGDPSDQMLQAVQHYVENQVCKSSIPGPVYPFTRLTGLQANAGAI